MMETTFTTVAKTPTMLDIEQRFGGRDIRTIVAECYARTGSLRKVAHELGCSRSLHLGTIYKFEGKYKTLGSDGRDDQSESA